MNEKYREYLASEEWAEIKLDLIQKRGARCERCKLSKSVNRLHIHHKTYERIFNELPSDLIILCNRCHMKEHLDKIPKEALIKVGIIKPKKKQRKKKNKNTKPLTLNGVINKFKSGGYKNNKQILKAYKKAIKGRRI